jgi:hypothetical protein
MTTSVTVTTLDLMREIVMDLSPTFTLTEVYARSQDIQEAYPNNNTVHATMRRDLQRLRDEGLIEFLNIDGSVATGKYAGSGNYRRAGHVDTHVEIDEEKIVLWGASVAMSLTEYERALFLQGFAQGMASELDG